MDLENIGVCANRGDALEERQRGHRVARTRMEVDHVDVARTAFVGHHQVGRDPLHDVLRERVVEVEHDRIVGKVEPGGVHAQAFHVGARRDGFPVGADIVAGHPVELGGILDPDAALEAEPLGDQQGAALARAEIDELELSMVDRQRAEHAAQGPDRGRQVAHAAGALIEPAAKREDRRRGIDLVLAVEQSEVDGVVEHVGQRQRTDHAQRGDGEGGGRGEADVHGFSSLPVPALRIGVNAGN